MRKLINCPNILTNIILPLITMALWGSLFPFIKMGYKAFDINTNSVADILMFAALRFVVCGAIVCIIAHYSKAEISKPKIKSIAGICFMGVFAIVLHYGFTYVGLSITDSSKTAIMKQIAPLLYVCFSFLFNKDENFSITKIFGATVGFGGIIAINFGTSFYGFSLGDLLIISASICTVISMIISKKNTKGASSLWITGISQLFGGAVLLVIALLTGGKMPSFAIDSFWIFAYICAASVTGYTIFYYVQRTVKLSNLFIIKFAEPLFACIFSVVLLGENVFKVQYIVAFALISLGIVLGNIKSE